MASTDGFCPLQTSATYQTSELWPFEHTYLQVFRTVHKVDASFQTQCHEPIPAWQFLAVLQVMLRSLSGAAARKIMLFFAF